MRTQIGVMGSAGGPITPEELDLARRLGRRIAERGAVLITGACPGLPHASALGAVERGGLVVGISPAHSREEHVGVYESPLKAYGVLIFTGSGLMGREVHNIHTSDFVLFVGGRSGTLGEFSIAFDEGKLIGILTHSGGLSDQFATIARMTAKDTGSIMIENSEPEALVDACLERYLSEPIPTSHAFNHISKQPRG